MTPEDLVEWRRRWGFTQAEFAREVFHSKSAVRWWERVKGPPKWLRLWIKGWEAEKKEGL